MKDEMPTNIDECRLMTDYDGFGAFKKCQLTLITAMFVALTRKNYDGL